MVSERNSATASACEWASGGETKRKSGNMRGEAESRRKYVDCIRSSCCCCYCVEQFRFVCTLNSWTAHSCSFCCTFLGWICMLMCACCNFWGATTAEREHEKAEERTGEDAKWWPPQQQQNCETKATTEAHRWGLSLVVFVVSSFVAATPKTTATATTTTATTSECCKQNLRFVCSTPWQNCSSAVAGQQKHPDSGPVIPSGRQVGGCGRNIVAYLLGRRRWELKLS